METRGQELTRRMNDLKDRVYNMHLMYTGRNDISEYEVARAFAFKEGVQRELIAIREQVATEYLREHPEMIGYFVDDVALFHGAVSEFVGTMQFVCEDAKQCVDLNRMADDTYAQGYDDWVRRVRATQPPIERHSPTYADKYDPPKKVYKTVGHRGVHPIRQTHPSWQYGD